MTGLHQLKTFNLQPGQIRMNNNIIVSNPNSGIDRCGCPECNGCAGTTRVCFNARKLAARRKENIMARNVGMVLFINCLVLPERTIACVGNPAAEQPSRARAGEAQPTALPAYYQSDDNPLHAD
jgi:hypothetical protein